MKEAIIVYDEEGKEYLLEGKTEYGYVVRPIFDNPITWWADGHENMEHNMEYGSIQVLDKIYKELPTQKKHEEIEQLNKDIKHLEGARDRLKRELDELSHQIIDIKQKELEDVLNERLKEVPLAKELIHILLHDYPEYGIRSDNTPYSSHCTTLAIRTKINGEKELIKLQQDGTYSNKYHEVDFSKCKFKTLEDAELEALKHLNNKFSEKPRYWTGSSGVKEIDKLFDKHKIDRSEDWISYYNKIKQGYINQVKHNIECDENSIQTYNKRIEDYKKELRELIPEK